MPKQNRVFYKKYYFSDCLICGKSYNNDLGLKLHMKHSHQMDAKPSKKDREYDVQCGICKKRNCKMH